MPMSEAQKSLLASMFRDGANGHVRAWTSSSRTWFALQNRGFVTLTAHDPVNVYADITPTGRVALKDTSNADDR